MIMMKVKLVERNKIGKNNKRDSNYNKINLKKKNNYSKVNKFNKIKIGFKMKDILDSYKNKKEYEGTNEDYKVNKNKSIDF